MLLEEALKLDSKQTNDRTVQKSAEKFFQLLFEFHLCHRLSRTIELI